MTRSAEQLNTLTRDIPLLEESCGTFTKKAEEISSERELNNLIFTNFSKISEFLEIPQIMDTCVRNDFHQEALELQSFVHQLARMHPDIDIIQEIVISSLNKNFLTWK